MALSAHKDALFFSFLCGILVVITFPIWEILRERARGVIDVRFIIIGMVANVFWFVFALLGVKNMPLIVMNPIAFAIGSITLWLWIQYPNVPKKA